MHGGEDSGSFEILPVPWPGSQEKGEPLSKIFVRSILGRPQKSGRLCESAFDGHHAPSPQRAPLAAQSDPLPFNVLICLL
jgi:hypothetical protein